MRFAGTNKALLIPTYLALLFAHTSTTLAQYGHDYGSGHLEQKQVHYGGGPEVPEDRPRVQLGIRLKIPAIKFELPRFNLPKITVSAKIRQPDGPRVITLPEINLDTSSNQQVNNGQHHQGYSYGSPGAGGNEQTFSFSSQGQEDQQQQHPVQQHHYGGDHQDEYSPPPHQQQEQLHEQGWASSSQNPRKVYSTKPVSLTPGLKLSQPLYIRPQDRQQPIEAYGRVPLRAFHQQPARQGFFRPQQVVKTNGHRFNLINED